MNRILIALFVLAPALLFGANVDRSELISTNNLIRAQTVAKTQGSGTSNTFDRPVLSNSLVRGPMVFQALTNPPVLGAFIPMISQSGPTNLGTTLRWESGYYLATNQVGAVTNTIWRAGINIPSSPNYVAGYVSHYLTWETYWNGQMEFYEEITDSNAVPVLRPRGTTKVHGDATTNVTVSYQGEASFDGRYNNQIFYLQSIYGTDGGSANVLGDVIIRPRPGGTIGALALYTGGRAAFLGPADVGEIDAQMTTSNTLRFLGYSTAIGGVVDFNNLSLTVGGQFRDGTLRGVNSRTIIEAADGVNIAEFGFSDYSVHFPQVGNDSLLYLNGDVLSPATIGAGITFALGEIALGPGVSNYALTNPVVYLDSGIVIDQLQLKGLEDYEIGEGTIEARLDNLEAGGGGGATNAIGQFGINGTNVGINLTSLMVSNGNGITFIGSSNSSAGNLKASVDTSIVVTQAHLATATNDAYAYTRSVAATATNDAYAYVRSQQIASNAVFLTTNKVTGSAVTQNGDGTVTINSTGGTTETNAWLWSGFDTNQSINWGLTPSLNVGTNWVAMQPSNSTTLAFANAPAAGTGPREIFLLVYWTNAAGTSFTWPASVVWPDGQAPGIIAGRTNLYWFTWTGTNIIGSAGQTTNVYAEIASVTFHTNWINSVSNLVQTKQNGSAALTNLAGLPSFPFTNLLHWMLWSNNSYWSSNYAAVNVATNDNAVSNLTWWANITSNRAVYTLTNDVALTNFAELVSSITARGWIRFIPTGKNRALSLPTRGAPQFGVLLNTNFNGAGEIFTTLTNGRQYVLGWDRYDTNFSVRMVVE